MRSAADPRVPLSITDTSIRPARGADRAAIPALAERVAAFGPTTRSASEIAGRERRALSEALDNPLPGSALLVATVQERGVVGVLLWMLGATILRMSSVVTWRFSRWRAK